ncbi:MAG: TDT family transporter [Sarcina sp.]
MGVYIKKLENYPIGVCGTALSFLTLSNAYGAIHIDFLKPIAVVFGFAAIFLMILKLIFQPRSIINDLKNPVAGSFYTTVDMATFLIAAYFHKSYPVITSWIWIICVVIHFTLVIIYTILRLKNHKFSEVLPSWYTTYVGIVVGAIVSKGMGDERLALFMLYFGTFSYLVCYPFMLYKIFTKKFTKAQIATTGVMAAPGGLAVAGFITLYKEINIYFLSFLIILLIFNVLIAYYFASKLFRQKFTPALAAFTFPLAISSLATYKVVGYFRAHNLAGLEFFRVIALIEIIIISAIIAYVIINFLILFVKAVRDCSKSNAIA